MAVATIRLFGDPVLRTPAEPVVDFDKHLRKLVKDMTDTMLDAPGVGLAAPQVGVLQRVFTWWIDEEVGHIVNPVVEASEQTYVGEEGCLSIPGLAFDVERALDVVVRGQDQHGEPLEITGHGLMARCAQHETDHLDGILFIDRLDREQRKAAMRAIRESDWAGPKPLIRSGAPVTPFGHDL